VRAKHLAPKIFLNSITAMTACHTVFFPAPPESFDYYPIQYKNLKEEDNNNDLIQILRENWSKRQENGGIDPIKEEVQNRRQEEKENQPEENQGKKDGSMNNILRKYLYHLLDETVAKTVRKENVFEDELTEEEMKIIALRVAEQRKRYEEFEKRENQRKIDKLQSLFPYLTAEVLWIYFALINLKLLVILRNVWNL